jgi:hypothetical protein
MKQIGIVTPVYNDWRSFRELIAAIGELGLGQEIGLHILAINDGSSDRDLVFDENRHALLGILSIEIIHLFRNLGHQRAIAVGLVEMSQRENLDCVIVMDADGEDRPEDIPSLLQVHTLEPDAIVVVRRQKRSEGLVFRSLYWLYKMVFFLLVGIRINFGNFSLIPARQLSRLIYDSNIWNNFAATLIHSKMKLRRIDADRGNRYAGKSRMNMISLVMHGLSAVSVFTEIVIVRILIGTGSLFLLSCIGIGGVVFIRLATDLAIPGWATNAVGLLFIIIIQLVSFSLISVFVILNNRASPFLIPNQVIQTLIESRETVYQMDIG